MRTNVTTSGKRCKEKTEVRRTLFTLLYEIYLYFVRNNAAFLTFFEEPLDGFPAAFAVVERQVVYPHRYKTIGQLRLHIACELHSVRKCILAIFHRVNDAVVEVF